ncbi:hypothetical protein FBR06_06800 [Betaproteobacteria bacterium PRO4]|nr:hypothetical protein [Betaproteobacteria bacterium PRO4]
MSNLEALVQQFINSRLPPEEQYQQLLQFVPQDTLDKAFAEFRRQTGRVRRMTPPPLLSQEGGDQTGWYLGGDKIPHARFWPALKEHLLYRKNWTQDAVDSINGASDKIVAWLEHPVASRFQTRGLVVGYVQSGKTANFTAVIAKAADAGYRVFIVLSGTKISLRAQTQRRLDRELVELNDVLWYTPTRTNDFNLIDNPNYFLDPDKDSYVLCVVKKNSPILRRLIRWLSDASPEILNRCPFLIIDDEADEASINTAANQAQGDPETYRRTAINQRLIELLQLLPKAAYIGYTATPFASVLVDPRSKDDLYPRHFIAALPKPDGHFGTERIFGRERLLWDETDEEFEGLDMVRIVPIEELTSLQPVGRNHYDFLPAVTPSLQNAVDYFWMAAAARWVRGQQNEHSTMLIHTTQYIHIHNTTQNLIEHHRRDVLRMLNGPQRDNLLQQWRQQWDDEQSRLPRDQFTEQPVSFDALLPHLLEVITQTQVVVDNYRSENRLNYENGTRLQIAIGGNTLSRGLTLEGLLVSFFVRAANAYDTLLQMGRWFGYRPNYADLPRLWMTAELRDYFYDLATVEAEVRQDIERYSELGMTPEQFGVRIRTHPALAITARAKMQHAVQTRVSYDNNNVQTVLFNHRNATWLQRNLRAADELIKHIRALGYQPAERLGHQVFYGISVDIITSFLDQYQFHEMSREVSTRALKDYIRQQNRHNALRQWNVVLRGVTAGEKAQRGSIQLGGFTVPLLERSRRTTPVEYANIGVLMSDGDTGADLSIERSHYKGRKAHEIREMRQAYSDTKDRGMLVLYLISKDSQPGKSSAKTKRPLEAADHLVGLGFVFPPAPLGSVFDVEYVEVNPDHLEQYVEPDFLEEDESDSEA